MSLQIRNFPYQPCSHPEHRQNRYGKPGNAQSHSHERRGPDGKHKTMVPGIIVDAVHELDDHPAESHHIVVEGIGRHHKSGGHQQRVRQVGIPTAAECPDHGRYRCQREHGLQTSCHREREARHPRIHECGWHVSHEILVVAKKHVGLHRHRVVQVRGPDACSERECCKRQ